MPQHLDIQAMGFITADRVSLIYRDDDTLALFIDGKETGLNLAQANVSATPHDGPKGKSVVALFIETPDLLVRTTDREVRSH